MKRWIVPVLCAAGIHVVLFNLDPEWSRPAFSVNESRAVTISLVEVPRESERQPSILPLAPPRLKPIEPLAALKPRPVPAPKPVPAPVPSPAAEPERRAPEIKDEIRSEDVDVSPQQSDDTTAPPTEAVTERRDYGPEQAEVQPSVPVYALNPPPAYPPLARRRNHQGTVMLDVLVDHRGRATRVEVARSSGHTLLDQSAVESVRSWRFEPARRFGQPIEMWVQVPVRFALE